jgi:hypothetical protein
LLSESGTDDGKVSAVSTVSPSSRQFGIAELSRIGVVTIRMTIVPFWEILASAGITPSCEALISDRARERDIHRLPARCSHHSKSTVSASHGQFGNSLILQRIRLPVRDLRSTPE